MSAGQELEWREGKGEPMGELQSPSLAMVPTTTEREEKSKGVGWDERWDEDGQVGQRLFSGACWNRVARKGGYNRFGFSVSTSFLALQ